MLVLVYSTTTGVYGFLPTIGDNLEKNKIVWFRVDHPNRSAATAHVGDEERETVEIPKC